MMRIICHDVVVAAEQLGISTDMLKREQQALSEQENKVVAMTDHMERKEAGYRERGASPIPGAWRIPRSAYANMKSHLSLQYSPSSRRPNAWSRCATRSVINMSERARVRMSRAPHPKPGIPFSALPRLGSCYLEEWNEQCFIGHR